MHGCMPACTASILSSSRARVCVYLCYVMSVGVGVVGKPTTCPIYVAHTHVQNLMGTTSVTKPQTDANCTVCSVPIGT